jgi:hypothetical protein
LRHDPAFARGLPVHMDPELPIGPEFLRGMLATAEQIAAVREFLVRVCAAASR